MSCLSHAPRLAHSNYTLQGVQITKLLVLQFFSAHSCTGVRIDQETLAFVYMQCQQSMAAPAHLYQRLLTALFISQLLGCVFTSLESTRPNYGLPLGWGIGNSKLGGGLHLVWSAVSVYAWRDWGKSQSASVLVAGFRVRFRAEVTRIRSGAKCIEMRRAVATE